MAWQMQEGSSVETVFLENGMDSYFQYYRHPGLIIGADGVILAYYSGQHFGIEKTQALFCRISYDTGLTWSDRILLAEGGSTGMLHNTMMAYSNGLYHCLWNVQYRQLWYRSSSDGKLWSAPRDLTRTVWRADTHYPWNAFGIGSGHCLTLQSGRILIPAWFTTGGDSHKPSAFGNLYTDDDFETLGIGEMLVSGETLLNPNEGAITETRQGDILATIRHDNTTRARVFARSEGGVGPWRDIRFRPELPDPICHASMIRAAWPEDGGDVILFCNCANADPNWRQNYESGKSKYLFSNDARTNLTLRASCDGGLHFSKGIRLAEKGGYSDLAVVGNRAVCLYETGWLEEEGCIFPRQIAAAALDWRTEAQSSR